MRRSSYISVVLLITGLFAVAPSATAAFSFEEVSRQDEVSIDIIGGDSLAVDPGDVVTLVYKIHSDQSGVRNLTPSFDIPQGWSVVFGTDTLKLSPEEPTTRLVTYKVPESSLAGSYKINLALLDAEGNAIGNKSAGIGVNAIFAIDLDADPMETYAAAGKLVQVTFTLSNDGNAPISVNLDAVDRKFADVRLPYSSIDLAPKESVTFTAEINTDANLDHTQRANLRFEAQIAEKSEIFDFETVAFDIVPVYSRIRPKAARVPLSLALETVGDESGIMPQATIAAQTHLLGGNVSVIATLAEMPRQKFFGADQRLEIQYENEDVTVKLGDHSQSISPMTLTGEQGLGIGAEVKTTDWTFKGTVQRSRFVFPVQERFAASAAYQTSPSSFVSANLLHRNEFYDGTLLTLRSSSQPLGSSSRMDVECGIDSSEALRDPSCSVQFSDSGSRLSYRIRAQKASESFPGTLAGLRQISEYASFRLNDRFRLDNTYRRFDRSLGGGFARSSSLAKAGVTYTDRIHGGTLYLTAHGIRTKSTYSNIRSDADRSELIARTTLGYHMRSIGLTVSMEEGRTTSTSEQKAGSLRRFKTNFRVSPLPRWTLNASVEASTGSLSALSVRQSQKQYGLGSTISLPREWTASVIGFHSQVKTLIDQQYSSLRSGLSKSFRSGRTLSAQVQLNRSTGRSTVQTADYRLSFTTPLSMPFGGKGFDDEMLRGRVTDEETGLPLSGVLVFLGDKLAISDDKGRFVFPRPELAVEFLRVDQNSIGYDRTPAAAMPMEIDPSSFLNSELNLIISKASSITGDIFIYHNSASSDLLVGNPSDKLVQEGGINGAIVQISNEKHRQRTRTSRSGSFRFDQLPSGEYTIEIIRIQHEEHQQISTTSFKVFVKQGESEYVLFRVEPKRKSIRMIQSSTLSVGDPKDNIRKIPVLKGDHVSSDSVKTKKNDWKARTPNPETPVRNESKPAKGKWSDQMLDSAKEAPSDSLDAFSAVSIPYYVEIEGNTANEKRSGLVMLLFVLCVLFVLLDVDLLVRHAMDSFGGPIKSMNSPVWLWTIRQAAVYALGIGFFTLWAGVLEGFAVSLALGGITVAVESWNTYRAIGNIMNLTFLRRAGSGSWIPYRNSTARIVSISLESVELELLNGNTVKVATHAIRRLSPRKWTSNSVVTNEFEIQISRMSNLKLVRSSIEETLALYAPEGTSGNVHIEFIDVNESDTIASIRTVIDKARPDHGIISAVVEKELAAYGVELRSVRLHAPDSPFGPLKLVQLPGTKAA